MPDRSWPGSGCPARRVPPCGCGSPLARPGLPGISPGRTGQDRWNASGAGIDGRADWRPPVAQWLRDTGRIAEGNLSAERQLSAGMMQLICADVVRPGMSWLLTTATPRNLSSEMARVRDPAGFSKLSSLGSTSLASYPVTRTALEWVAVIVAAKGGVVAGITG